MDVAHTLWMTGEPNGAIRLFQVNTPATWYSAVRAVCYVSCTGALLQQTSKLHTLRSCRYHSSCANPLACHSGCV